MSFPSYEGYKDSGVAWLGQIPQSWRIVPLLAVADERTDTNLGMRETNLLSLSYGQIVQKDINANDGLLPESFETYQVVQPGDVVWRLTDLQNDKRSLRTAIVNQTGIITSAYLATTPKAIVPQFLNYLLRAYDTTKVFYSMGGGLRQSMKFSDVKRLATVLPPVSDQSAIVAFLDRETTKIESLVEEQRRLIELLQEKRQAVISHAVTKGVNSNVPMKPSGIEWLGDVPAHWTVLRVKNLCTVISKGTTPTTVGADFTIEGVRFLKAENITESGVAGQPEFYISKSAHDILIRSCLHEGDVLVVIAGATTGKSAVLGKELLPANTNQAVSFLRPNDTSFSHYISLWLGTRLVRNLVLLNSVQSAQPNLAMEDLGNIPILVPPRKELGDILTQMAAEISKLDTLTFEAEHAIDLLQERRTALISAAVTGKIDVGRLAPAKAEAA